MIRKTMRIGEVRTSIKLEQQFWDYLKQVAEARSIRLSHLVNDVARASPDRTNLASTLRTFALIHAQLRLETQRTEVEKLRLAGSTQDLARVIDHSPLPTLVISDDRSIRRLNPAFKLWLNLDEKAVLGQRLDHIMVIRGQGMAEMWERLFGGKQGRASFSTAYISPGRVHTAQAHVLGLSASEGGAFRAGLVQFEKIAGRS